MAFKQGCTYINYPALFRQAVLKSLGCFWGNVFLPFETSAHIFNKLSTVHFCEKHDNGAKRLQSNKKGCLIRTAFIDITLM
jgi:hypothetical protein